MTHLSWCRSRANMSCPPTKTICWCHNAATKSVEFGGICRNVSTTFTTGWLVSLKKYSKHNNSIAFLAILLICSGCCENFARKCRRAKHYSSRTIQLDKPIEKPSSFPVNIIRNQKYSILTFVPLVSLFNVSKFSILWMIVPEWSFFCFWCCLGLVRAV